MKENGAEALVPERTGIPWPNRAWLSPWLAIGLVSAIVFVALSRVPRQSENVDVTKIWETSPLLYRAYFGYLGNTVIIEIAALAAIWIALLRPAWSDRLLWCAATILTAAFVIVPILPRGFYRHDYATIGMIGYASWAIVAWYSSMRPLWRSIVLAACGVSLVFAFSVPFVAQMPATYFVGSLALASSIWCFSVALVTGFHVDLFARD